MRLGSYEQEGHWPWLQSIEFGFLEGGDGHKGSETGDLYSVQYTIADVESEPLPMDQWRYGSLLTRKYKPGGELHTVQGNGGILNGSTNERPIGEWNVVELVTLGQIAIHVVNGKVNMAATGTRREVDGKILPLTQGTIQFQSEAAEVFYRHLRLKSIRSLPPEYLAQIQSDRPNTLTAVERASGWTLLFDGKTTDGWRGFRMQTMPDEWHVRDGALICGTNGGDESKPHTDIVTREAFDDFELQFEWKTPPGGNSGVFFRVSEAADAVYHLAPEFEIRDNATWKDSPYPAGSNYGLHAAPADVAKPVGDWNHSSILAEGEHVEHWLNGTKVVEYDLSSADWRKRLSQTHFASNAEFAKARKGPIALQTYGFEVQFRNIKIRSIAAQGSNRARED
jgi:hypothetical protein